IMVQSLQVLWENAFLAIFCSLVWLFLVLLIIPGPPATMAIYAIAERIASKEPLIDFRDYWDAIWQHFGLGWRWALINLPILGLLLVDIRTIPRLLPLTAAAAVQIFFIGAAAFWCVLNWFALAFLFQQKELKLRLAFRNAIIMIFNHPLLTSSLVAFTVIALWVSLLFVIVNMLFGPMFIGLVATITVEKKLAQFRESQEVELAIPPGSTS
ncbi:MAG: DUF624 domain-containing protein, partial [Chloroflexi bacterium]